MNDYMIRGMDREGRLRAFVARTTGVVDEARKIHNTSATATAAIGRLLTAGLIMGATMKNDDDLMTLKVSGDGPVGTLTAVANSRGEVKGLLDNPAADAPSTEDGKLDVGAIVGKNGTFVSIRDIGMRDPYVGQTSLVSGEIGDDIANFYSESEQIPTAVGLGVLVDKDLSCKAAGGFIIQLMPFITDEEISMIESSLKKARPLSTLIDEGYTPEEIMNELLSEFNMETTEKIDVSYTCDCSFNKVEKVLISLGESEVQDIIDEDGESEVVCHFCNTKYHFSRDDLQKILLTIKDK
ncbi:Hsp33 family molecular chaperone HslO [Gudongella sp. DL1XJH-153]|uniref:Hsp33 family molecular chaperone HslO n=1 Tax=Gudongella sp. DL1XJH-153 TaxID=3409804 RepID=UPI003BB4F800